MILLNVATQPKSIPRRLRTAAIVLALLLSAPSPDARATAMAGPAVDVPVSAQWAASPAHARLFTPAAHRDRYRAFVSRRSLDELVAEIAALSADSPPGAWRPEALPPLDAFGLTGTYDRFALARLYLRTPVRVARGPRASSGGLQSWTLISPYPDARLAALEPGTLLIVLDVPPL